MAAAFPREGYRDLRGRLRSAWLWAVQRRVGRELSDAEAELGWLAWQQVDFYDEQIIVEVEKIQEFEATQATIENTAAELSARKAALNAELDREKADHDKTQASLAADRAPFAVQLQQAETTRRRKMEAIDRFDRAIEEMARLEKELEEHSRAYMKVDRPDIAIRIEARKISDELARIPDERKRVIADKINAAQEAAGLEPEIARYRAELQRIDSASAAARERLAEATRRITGEKRVLDRQKKKTTLHMSHLDRKKREPYRFVGACLADHGIAPLNQPAVLQKVFSLRERNLHLAESLAELRAARAAADPGLLIAFYLLLAALLFCLSVVACHVSAPMR
jgi:chromosome segregation ATPase